MGASKKRKQLFLQAHNRCTYCGAPLTITDFTFDHCPPRCFFERREWPEGYKFAACLKCNSQSSKDEQLLAVLTRIRHDLGANRESYGEWKKLVEGVGNNRPDVLMEWNAISTTQVKRFMRGVFGANGFTLRRAGWGAINFGPLTHAAAHRFLIKMAKALYYKYVGTLFDGYVYIQHISVLDILQNHDAFLEAQFDLAVDGGAA